jgi:hypothetical protein
MPPDEPKIFEEQIDGSAQNSANTIFWNFTGGWKNCLIFFPTDIF